jgi:hypothetical protein
MTASFNDPLPLILCDHLWHNSSPPDCLAKLDDSETEPEPEQELPEIKPEPEPEPKLEPGCAHSLDHLSVEASQSSTKHPQQHQQQYPRSVYDAWLASRVPSRQNGGYITAGAQRPLTRANLRLAHRIAELCVPQMLQLFWSRHPFRAFIMVALSFVRGTFPVFKGYTHALIINEVSNRTVRDDHSHVLNSQPHLRRSRVYSRPVITLGLISFICWGLSFYVWPPKSRWTCSRELHFTLNSCIR